MRRLAPIVLIALLATSCALSPPSSSETPVCEALAVAPSPTAPSAEVYLPTYCPMDQLPAGETRGHLVEADGCLWIDHADGRMLPLWPPGSRIERDGPLLVVLNSGGARAVVGTEVYGGGGEFGQGDYDLVVETIGDEVPEACRGNDSYWLVYDVRASGE